MRMTIKYKSLAPTSHIGETASTGSYFNTIQTANGKMPVITGNAIRGQLRDSIALHLLDSLNISVSKETFNILFSGGNINGSMREDVEKAKQIRQHFPAISLMGGGLGDMIMSGKLSMSFVYPVCVESEDFTGVVSNLSWHDLIDEIEFTRTDDSKNDIKSKYITDINAEKQANASTQMRYAVQYMAAGTEWVQHIIFSDSVNELEYGAFYAGILKWFKTPMFGGMGAKGFGLFDANVNNGTIVLKYGNIAVSDDVKTVVNNYEKFIGSESGRYFDLFNVKAVKKNGKETDDAD